MESDEKNRRLREKLTRELGPTVCAALNDPKVVEVMLNPNGELWIDRLGEPMAKAGTMTASAAESLMATIADSLHTVVNRENPILEGELPTDGSRFEGLLPPIVVHPAFTIRKRALQIFTLEDYVRQGIMTQEQREGIEAAVRERKNILVVGGTGTGKTTLTNAILQYMGQVAAHHRIVLIEDTRELQCTAQNRAELRTTQTIGMQQLLRATMRLRPDRIVVGEVRGAEALALLKAWNTGHPGGVATVHANDAAAALIRVEQLVNEGLNGGKIDPSVIGSAIDLLVVITKCNEAPGRKISEISTVEGYVDGQYRLRNS